MLLDEVGMFAKVAAAGSLASAARQLGVPKSTLSRAIARLEEATGAALFHRSARAIALTDEGRRFFERVMPLVDGLDEAARALGSPSEEPDGLLKVSLPNATGDLLAPVLARFAVRHPRVRLDLHTSSRRVDLLREGFDVALRGTITDLEGADLTAQRLGSGDIELYASPTYLARRGTPRTLLDLADHDLVSYPPAVRNLPARPEGLRQAFAHARFAVDDFSFIRALLVEGSGIGPLQLVHARRDVDEGRLARVLPEWTHRLGSLYIVYPSARRQPRALVAFRDFLKASLTWPRVLRAS
jgi:DNA-binding transcriptional LysR family regulator